MQPSVPYYPPQAEGPPYQTLLSFPSGHPTPRPHSRTSTPNSDSSRSSYAVGGWHTPRGSMPFHNGFRESHHRPYPCHSPSRFSTSDEGYRPYRDYTNSRNPNFRTTHQHAAHPPWNSTPRRRRPHASFNASKRRGRPLYNTDSPKKRFRSRRFNHGRAHVPRPKIRALSSIENSHQVGNFPPPFDHCRSHEYKNHQYGDQGRRQRAKKVNTPGLPKDAWFHIMTFLTVPDICAFHGTSDTVWRACAMALGRVDAVRLLHKKLSWRTNILKAVLRGGCGNLKIIDVPGEIPVRFERRVVLTKGIFKIKIHLTFFRVEHGGGSWRF